MKDGAMKGERKMEERKEETIGTGMLERLQKLYAEREEEYQKREKAFEERRKAQENREKKLKEWAEKLKEEQDDIAEKERHCNAQAETLTRRERETEEKERHLAGEEGRLAALEAEIKETAGQKVLEAQILVEEARNEKLKEQRVREEYEARLAETGGGEGNAPLGVLKCNSAEEIQILRERHEEETRLLHQKYGEELNAKDKAIAELKTAMDGLEKEKAGLFRKLLSLPENEDVPESSMAKKEPVDVPKSGTIESNSLDVSESGTQEGKEELTAEVLLKYLQKNGEGKAPKLFHAYAGDQVRMEENGLSYVFAFEKPPYFDIRIKQRGGGGKKELLSEYAAQYPGVEIAYDQTAGEVVASGYFTQEMDASAFLKKVRGIAACLSRKEG